MLLSKKQNKAANNGTLDMTSGNILRLILTFSAPLLLGNIFQQAYNMVDTWVVGKYASNEAFSAVGSVGPIINLLIGFFTGLASGAGVIISHYYGAKQFNNVKKATYTFITITVCFAIVLSIAGVLLIPLMLKIMKVPSDVYGEATTYLKIIFAGVSGLMIYNMGAGILRAVGDSKRPFYYLVAAAVTNVVLDLYFVIKLDLGVAGVAYATVIAQGVSALLIVLRLLFSDTCVSIKFKEFTFDRKIAIKIFTIGTPYGIQLAITAFSNVFVQSYINQFGSDVMAGWTAYSKIDQFLFLPMQSISIAVTTFIGQNLGKGDTARAKKGLSVSMVTSIACTISLIIPIVIFAPAFTAFFNDKPIVIEYGALLLRTITPFYVLACINQIYCGALRGTGNSKVPMFIMLGSFVLFRQGYLYIVSNFICNKLLPLAMGYPAGWFVASLLCFIYYRIVGLNAKEISS